MKLSLTLLAAAIVLRFDLPQSGDYWLFSSVPGTDNVKVEASGYASKACEVSKTLPRTSAGRIYWVRFDKD